MMVEADDRQGCKVAVHGRMSRDVSSWLAQDWRYSTTLQWAQMKPDTLGLYADHPVMSSVVDLKPVVVVRAESVDVALAEERFLAVAAILQKPLAEHIIEL